MNKHVLTASVLLLGLAVAGCAGDEPQEPAFERFVAGIEEGHERYPDVGTVGRGDRDWRCPLDEEVVVDGETLTPSSLSVTFALLEDGVHEVSCGYDRDEPRLLATVRYAVAEDDDAYERLVEGTRAVRQSGNVQTEKLVEVGGRDVVVVRTEFPTNASAGVRYQAYALDEESRSRVTLEVDGSGGGRSADYDEDDAAHDLDVLLAD